MVTAALNGSLAQVGTVQDSNFGLHVPQNCPDVPAEVLTPRNTWADQAAYDATARDLAGRFADNFSKYEPYVDNDVKASAIRPAA